MRKQVLALMDSEENYALRFMDHVNRKKTSPFEVHAFTDREKLCAYSKTHRIEILLISEHDMEEAMQVRAGRTVVLTDGTDSGGLYPNICKYQASSAVMQQVMEVYGSSEEEPGAGRSPVLKPQMKTIGVFSPVARCMKTSFALALGQCLARTKATLYLNFETSSGLTRMMGKNWDRNLSDVIYYIRRGEENITARLLPLVKEVGMLGFVPPAASPGEIYSVTADEWYRLFSSLRRDSAYEALILDLGVLPLIYPDVLEECDIIYMPVNDDPFSRSKIEEFMEELRTRDLDAADHIVTLDLSSLRMTDTGGKWVERLPQGPLGAVAMERIAADRL
ncbi:MAG: hypothetical protein Q4G47_02285 [Lachnospiraceae bacterium]|nr:hypothetical protein [Lachnospiraceae bacterium]